MLTLRKSGNLIDLSEDGTKPLPDEVRSVLEPMLSYEKRKFLYGADRFNGATGQYDRRMEVIPKRCYKLDGYGRLVTNFGFSKKILDELYARNLPVNVINKDLPLDRPDAYVFDEKRIKKHFEYRVKQDECIAAIVDNPCGVVNAVTGFGKLVLIAMVCLAFPNAKIDVVTRRGVLVNKIARYLTRYIPCIGQVGGLKGGKKSKGRVTVYTAASLHHSDFDADIVLVDEAHELLADQASSRLAQYQHARLFGFTATPGGRIDGTDIRMDALFGWQIFYLAYPEALRLGLVVPIRVEWIPMRLTYNPCAGLDDFRRKQIGIWTNMERNARFAWKMKQFGPDDQVLVCVDTIEHAVNLWQHVKDDGYVLVYNKMEEGDMSKYKKQGMLPKDFPEMTPTLQENYRVEFEAGRLKKAISTMWDVGVDPVHLAALTRADAADSSIDDVQAPGRAARKNDANPGKVGIIIDSLDEFDRNLARRAKSRAHRYAANEWEQVVTQPDGTFCPLVLQ